MRNFFMLFIVFGLLGSNTYAQKVKIGIIAGPAISTSNGTNASFSDNDSLKDHTNKVKSNFSFFAGGVASIPIGKNFIFKPQLEYILKGWTTFHDFTNAEDNTTKLTSHWIEIPMNFFYSVPGRNGRFLFGLGPYVSCALSAKIHDDKDGSNDKIEFKKGDPSDKAKTANRIDIGANAAAQYEFRQGFFISLNYEHGFIDFRNDLKNEVNQKNKNILIGLGIGYTF